jgi:uncharacterized protein (DUF342 family)
MKVEKEAINSKPTHVDFPGMDDTERKMQRMTFQTNDWFERIDFAKNLCSLIQHCDDLKENESFSIAIDASWGMGKTQFIHMWRNLVIEKKDQLLEEMEGISTEVEEIEEELEAVKSARIKVRKTIYPGVKLTIGSASKYIKDAQEFAVFLLDGVEVKAIPFD